MSRLEEIKTLHDLGRIGFANEAWLISQAEEAEKLRGRLEAVREIVETSPCHEGFTCLSLLDQCKKWEEEDRGEEVSQHAGD